MADEPGKICFKSGEATVDATLVAEGPRLKFDAVPGMIRDGTITCAFERGIDDDEGKFRLTFWPGRQRFRAVVDSEGRVLQRLRIDYGVFSTPQFRATS
jgi:Family of unknown function (DUF6522)